MKTFYLLLFIPFLILNFAFGQDLTVTRVALPDSTIPIGSTFYTSIGIANLGATNADLHTIGLYLSTDSILTIDDDQIGNAIVYGLSPYQKDSIFCPANIPSQYSGSSYYLFAFIDNNGQVFETNEANNSLMTRINILEPYVDLSIPEINLYSKIVATGNQISGNLVIANTGNIIANGNVASFYISSDSLLDAQDTIINLTSIWAVMPKSTIREGFSFQLPANQPNGSYYLFAKVDYAQQIVETNENNNTQSATFRIVVPVNDIELTTLSNSDSVILGGNYYSFLSSLSNKGTTYVPYISTNYYLSADSLYSIGDTYLTSNYNYGLSPGNVVNNLIGLYIPNNIPTGKWYLLAVADPTNEIEENNETNNIKSVVLNVQAPILDVTLVDFTSSVERVALRTPFTVNAIIQNNSTTYIREQIVNYYLSSDTILGSNDKILTTSYVYGMSSYSQYFLNESLFISDSLPLGTYYIIARADANNAINEINEENNIKYLQIKVEAPFVDLSTSTFIVDTLLLYPGSTFNFHVQTTNNGNAYSDYHLTNYYISQDSLLDNGDTLVYTEYAYSLYPGASYYRYQNFNVPANSSIGSYYIITLTDADNRIAESNESNNITVTKIIVSQSTVDLVISKWEIPPSQLYAGSYGNFTLTEKNIGSTYAGYHSAGIVLSIDSIYDANDYPVSNFYVYGIEPGDSSYNYNSFYIPYDWPAGKYYLIAKADLGNQIGEIDETNNTLFVPITIIGTGLDLTINYLNVNTTNPSAGTFFYAYTTETNAGIESAGNHHVGYFLSTDPTYSTNDLQLNSDFVAGLQTGQSISLYPALFIPNNVADGYYYLICVADHGSNISEVNEDNNTRAIPITIGTPGSTIDLSLYNVYVSPNSIFPGTSIRVNYSQLNNGTRPSGESTVNFYITTDSLLQGEAILLGQQFADSINAGSSFSDTASFALPASVTPGNYYLVLVADADTVVVETNELNNNFTIPFRVRSRVIAQVQDRFLQSASLYPNPSNGIVYLKNFGEVKRLEVMNSSNQVMFECNPSDVQQGTVDLSLLENGFYFLRATDNDALNTTFKLVISK